jgi:pimeloyl-ACP methyl ester carboxylesterase
MAKVSANGIEIECEEFGRPDSVPLLLIMGLGAQMVQWNQKFCRQLAARGFRVIRFDNRDVGLSTKFRIQCPDPMSLALEALQGKKITPPYTLEDMADDAVGLLEALSIPAAHVVGSSMGGMIAQLIAIRHPDRVLTLTSMISSTGDADLSNANPTITALFAQPAPFEREAAIEHAMKMRRALAGPGFEFEDERIRAEVALSYDRDPEATAVVRQLLAVVTATERRDALGSVAVPALVIHGDSDPLVPVARGFDTAKALPNSKMLVIKGMGHEFPAEAWPEVIDAIAQLARQED